MREFVLCTIAIMHLELVGNILDLEYVGHFGIFLYIS